MSLPLLFAQAIGSQALNGASGASDSGSVSSSARGGNSSNVITNSTGDNTIFWVSILVMGYIIVTAIKR